MKKHFSLLTSFFLAASLLFAGCGQNAATGSAGEGESQTTEDAQTQTSESTSPSNSPEQPSESDESSALSNQDGTDSNGSPVVYFTSDISAEGMLAIYKALDWTPTGRVAVKLSTGEPPASNYLDPQLIMYSTALGATALVIRIVSCTVCGGGTIPLIREWLAMGMSMGSASAFMITGPATKITNLGALKIVLGL